MGGATRGPRLSLESQVAGLPTVVAPLIGSLHHEFQGLGVMTLPENSDTR